MNAARDMLESGIRKHARNGRNIKLWTDKWIESYPLSEVVEVNLWEDHMERTVANYWEQGKGWRWEELIGKLPDEVTGKLKLYIISENGEDIDNIYWTRESSGMFYVSSTYHSANYDSFSVQDASWERIWRLKVPNHMRAFMWLAKYERFLCNEERRRRHITSDGCYPSCLNVSETTDHVLRKCPKAKEVWKQVVGERKWWKMENLSFKEWMNTNLRGKKDINVGGDWPSMFAITVWWIWHWRNEVAFNRDDRELNWKIEWLWK